MSVAQPVGSSAGKETLASFEEADRHLRKTMSFTQILFMSIGAIIGSGWLFATLAAAGTAGPLSIFSWIIGAIFIFFVALTYAEIAGMLPRSGAIVRYPHLSHGAFTGWIIGWAYWLSAASVPAIEAIATVTYLGGKFPSTHLVATSGLLEWPAGIWTAVGLMAVFFVLNYFGIKLLSEVNRWVVWWKLLIPTATFAFLFTIFDHTNFSTLDGGLHPLGIGSMFTALSTSGIIFAYLGFRQSLDYAGESKNPQRDVPLATISCLAITMAIYVLLQFAFIGSINWHSIGIAPGNWAGLLGNNAWSTGPLYHALTAANVGALGAFAVLLLIDAAVSPGGTGWVYTGTSTRTFYGLSVDRYLPRVFQRMNRFGIPWVSLLGAFIVGCVFLIPSPSWYGLVGFITSATVLTYIMGGVGLPVLRKTAPGLPRPFVLRGHHVWAPIGFLAAVMIVYWSGYTVYRAVFEAVFFGLPLFAWLYAPGRKWANAATSSAVGVVFLGLFIWTVFYSHFGFAAYDIAASAEVVAFCLAMWAISNAEGRKAVNSTWWLIWLILATVPVSYFGGFGPLKNPTLHFPFGTIIEVGVGLVAYYLGVPSGYATEEIQEINRHAVRAVAGAGAETATAGAE